MKRKVLLIAPVGVAALVFVIQLIPIERTNPPVETEIPASPEVRAVLRRACYDCHSNETKWLWYSRVAPISWLVARDVREGRAEVNYSTWNRYAAADQLKKLAKGRKEVEKGKMPLWFYVAVHREARLSVQEVALLGSWVTSLGAPTQ